MSKTIRTRVERAESLANSLAKTIKGGEVFALIGELGSGKTTFTKHLARALKVRNRVTSPTFVIMQEHPLALKGKKPGFLYHLDVYRANSPADVEALGLNQIWDQDHTVTVIEWADKIKKLLPKKTIFIYFD